MRHSAGRTQRRAAQVGVFISFLVAACAEGAVTINEYPLTVSGAPQGMTLGPDGNLWFTEATGNKIGRTTTSGRLSEFTIPTPNAQPLEIAAGPDGNLWFTEYMANKIGTITTAGVITEFSLPVANLFPLGITGGPDGNVWFTANTGNKIGKITPAGIVTLFDLPNANSGPWGITSGPSGSLWFTEFDGQRIGQITTAGTITEFTVPGSGSGPAGITVGPDSNLWFTERWDNKIVRMTAAGVFTPYTIPTGGSEPLGIVKGLVNDGLWFTELAGNKIGILNVSAGGVVGGFGEYPIPTAGSNSIGVACDLNGNVWFAETGANKIGRLESTSWTFLEFPLFTGQSRPFRITGSAQYASDLWFTETGANRIGRIAANGTHQISEYTLPTSGAFPYAITAGYAGQDIWFTEYLAHKIGRITPAGVITEFPVPTAYAYPCAITAGSDGNIWFTECGTSTIGRLTPGGVFTEFTTPTPGYPQAITSGPDGNLWFTGIDGKDIGRITTAGVITGFAVPTAAGYSILSGEDGNLWYSMDGQNKIGRMTPAGVVTEFAGPTVGMAPRGLSTRMYIGGRTWFIDPATNTVGRMSAAGAYAEYPIPTPNASPSWSYCHYNYNVWFTEQEVDKLGEVVQTTVPQTLSVMTQGTGTGTVTSDVGGIDCGATCAADFGWGSSVVLTGAASPGSVQTQWGASGNVLFTTTTCTVQIGSMNQVVATFTGVRLTVTKAGTGAGSVISSPAGIDCGGTCTYDFTSQAHSPVTLTATAPAASVFTGWSGEGCSGTGTCQVTMSQARSVTATFTGVRLTVTKAGGGAGAVVSSPAGIDCGSTCMYDFRSAVNQPVTLTASAPAGSVFTGWSGEGCSGTGTCQVTMSQWRSVTATFVDVRLTVTKAGTGSGTVTSNPAGIDCGPTCMYDFTSAANQPVTLTASAQGGSVFTGWFSDWCGGTGTCQLTMNHSQSVTATFVGVRLTVTKAGTGSGTVTSNPAGIDCGGTCTYDFTSAVDQPVTLTASALAGSAFTGWSGEGCSGTGTCQVTMSQARSVTATFAPLVGRFYAVPPCRVLDTRDPDGASGGPILGPGQVRVFPVAGLCGVPFTATSVSVNVTVTQVAADGYVVVYAGDALTPPLTSTISFRVGVTRANNAVVGLSGDGLGRLSFRNNSTGSTQVILDVSGYFQ